MAAAVLKRKSVPEETQQEEGLLHVPASAHSHEGFRAWALGKDFPEKLRVLFWRGEVYLDMSKEEIRTHAAVKTEVAGRLFHLNEEIDFGNLYINGVLVTNVEAGVSNNPDMVAVFWDSLEAGKVRYENRRGKEMEIVGSPDWVLEIVSDGSVRKDTRLLRAAYHKAGVREYWLIDARGDGLDFDILLPRRKGFAAVPAEEGWKQSSVFGRKFRLTGTRDRRQAWKYRLESR